MDQLKDIKKTYVDESINYIKLFNNSTIEKSVFSQVQRLIWEKLMFPKRLPPCSIFLCSLCNCKSQDLSFCLKCGHSFCGAHFSDHHCTPGFGVDISTQQLFYYDSKLGRRFIFNPHIDYLIFSAKFAVIDGLPIQTNLDMRSRIFENPRPPMALHNLGNTCWLNSLLQCLVANPLLQKWFLSGWINVTEIDCPEAAIHKHLNRLYLSQNSLIPCFSLSDFIFSIWTLFPSYAKQEQFDSHEFFMSFRDKLDAYYQSHFDTSIFSTIFSWQFKVIESCESCEDTRTYLSPSSDLLLRIKNCSSLKEAIKEYLLGASARQCSNCNRPCKCQSFFNTLPPTLTIYFVRDKNMDKGQTVMQLDEDLYLDDYVDIDKKAEMREASYSLIGLVERPGSGDLGHEYAYVKKSGDWYKCDDNTVSKVINPSDIWRVEASLLFYVRKGLYL